MKRYLVFAWDDYNAGGGWNDFAGDFDTLDEAVVALGQSERTIPAKEGHWYVRAPGMMHTSDTRIVVDASPAPEGIDDDRLTVTGIIHGWHDADRVRVGDTSMTFAEAHQRGVKLAGRDAEWLQERIDAEITRPSPSAYWVPPQPEHTVRVGPNGHIIDLETGEIVDGD